jgi:guanylate kinase
MQDKRFALVIAGASGVGKTTVADIIAKDPRFSFSRSATTRKPRNDGRDDEYCYFDNEEFDRLVGEGEFLEHTDYGENRYGTLRSELERIILEGRNPILVLDLNGVRSFRMASLDFPVYIFYLFEELDVIKTRLYYRDVKGRDKDALATYRKRMSRNVGDYLAMPEICGLFDAFVKNDDAYQCANRLLSLTAELGEPSVAMRHRSEASATAEHLADAARNFSLE